MFAMLFVSVFPCFRVLLCEIFVSDSFWTKNCGKFFCLLMFGVKVASLIETGFSHFSSCYNLSFSLIIDFRTSNSAFSYIFIYPLIVVVYNFCTKVRFMRLIYVLNSNAFIPYSQHYRFVLLICYFSNCNCFWFDWKYNRIKKN